MLASLLRRSAVLALVLGLAAGCEERASDLEAGLGPAADQLLAGVQIPAKKRGGKRKRFADAPVFVDGSFRAMLKYNELPPTLPTRFKTFDDGKVVRRFAWTDYFAALGVDLSAIDAVHFYGGRDIICVVEGAELRRVGDAFRFSFTRATSGFPRLEIPEDGIRYNTFVDKLRAVAIYVEKPAPSYDFRDGLRLPDGTKVEKGFPYAQGERHGGTRVYLDGELVNVVHRRALDPDGQREHGYELVATLRGFGIDVERVAQAQLVGRDRITADLDAAALADVRFDVPRGSGGRIRLAGADPESAPDLDAVVLYAEREPADRRLPGYPGGSKDAQFRGEETNDSATRLAAHRMQGTRNSDVSQPAIAD